MTTRSCIKLLLLLLFLPCFGNSQTLEGRIRYLKISNWSKQMSSLDYLSQQQKDKIAYMWGNRSEWKSYDELYFSPTQSVYKDSDEKAEPDEEGYNWRKDIYFIQRNFEANTMHDAIQMLGKTYLIEDSLQAPDWKIKNDMKEVAGHICMNAVWQDTIKKQQIAVWFALDMPISAGPERLYGLPGIILEVDVNDGAMVLTADKIELKPLTTELDFPKKMKGKKVTEAQFREVVAQHLEEKRKAEEPWFWGIRY